MTKLEAALILYRSYAQTGCARLPNMARRESEKSSYKKGYEIRIVVHEDDEALAVLAALKKLGLSHGNPYVKRLQTVFPLYGKENVLEFCHWTEIAKKHLIEQAESEQLEQGNSAGAPNRVP